MSDSNAVMQRIRIAYFIWNLKPAGAERQLVELIRGLDRNVFEPCVIVSKPGKWDQDCPCPVYALSKGGSRSRIGKAIAGGTSFLSLVRILRRIRPHVFHSFLPEITLVLGAFAAKCARVPVFICNRRSSLYLYRTTAFLRMAEPIALRLTDEMSANSQSLREELEVVDRYPSEHITVIPNGVDTARFRPGLPSRKKEFGWPESSVVIGIVANFRACKRHNDFVDAAAIVYREHPDSRFVLVGNDGGTLQEVRRRIEELGLQGATRIVLGSSNPEEVYGTIDILVCTSETEGLSNVLLEAQACGIPVVATAVGGNPEAIQDGVQGVLVPVYNPEAVAHEVNRLIDDHDLRARIGAAGRKHAVDKYSLLAMVSGFQELYQRALARMARNVRGSQQATLQERL